MRAQNTLLIASGIFATFLVSCGSDKSEVKKDVDQELLDPKQALNTTFDGKIFSIPSPMQTALLLEEIQAPFKESYLSSLETVENYTTETKKALNLGIYGTDLGYLAIYKQNSTSLKYLAVVEKLTSDLGLEGAFDKSFMSRFEKNGSNKDSMMVLISDAFKKSDNFLKNSDRKPTSALILVGGWIESLYLACEINKEIANKKIVQRIGEQKQTLNSIIEILEQYNKAGANDELISDMNNLKTYFEQIEIVYNFVEPVTDAKKKMTTLKHTSEVKFDSNTLNFINQQINIIRDKIIE